MVPLISLRSLHTGGDLTKAAIQVCVEDYSGRRLFPADEVARLYNMGLIGEQRLASRRTDLKPYHSRKRFHRQNLGERIDKRLIVLIFELRRRPHLVSN